MSSLLCVVIVAVATISGRRDEDISRANQRCKYNILNKLVQAIFSRCLLKTILGSLRIEL